MQLQPSLWQNQQVQAEGVGVGVGLRGRPVCQH